jgi:hypothetical protein
VKLPDPVGDTEKLTDPMGVIGLPLDVSFTVAVQVVGWPIANVLGLQLTVVLAVLWVTFTARAFEALPE